MLVNFARTVVTGCSLLAKSGENSGSLLPVVGAGEPSWRFVAEDDTDEKTYGWKTLQCQRNLPLSITLEISKSSL
jgi:hypothetical protein